MLNAGDYNVSSTVYIPFDSFAAATGAPAATTNFAAADVLIYKNGGTTARSSANGITATTSFSSQTGLQMIIIDLSDNTDAGFYAAGNRYQVAVGDITIDGQTVRFWAGVFSIEIMPKVNVTQLLGTAWLTPGTAGTPDVNVKLWNALTTVELPLVPTTAGRKLDVSTGGEAGLDWANIGSPTTAQNLSATNIDVDQIVASVSGAVGSVTGAVGSVTGAVGSVTGAVGSVTGNVGGNVTGSVGSVVGNVGGNVTGSVGSVVGAVGSVTGAVGSVTGNVGGNVTGSTGSVVGNIGGNVNGNLAGDVQGNVDGSIGSLATQAATDVEDAVWDAVLASHLDAGSTGLALSSASAAGDPWGTALPGAYAAGTAGFIVGTNLDDTVSSRASATQATNIETDTQDIQSRLPTALISGRMNSDIEAINNTVVNGDGAVTPWGP